ncbi:hypothetical protein FIS27_17875 [Salmonella enterica subsp. enterica]|nr:hypothetical protein [Salmonella enterica subsp. enterica serovar Newport]
MSFERVVIDVPAKQKVEFDGKEVARTSDSKYVVYETPKGYWVVIEKQFKQKSSANRNTRPEFVLTGHDSEYTIIKDKNQKELFDLIGFNKHLDDICKKLGINPSKSLDL